MTISEERRFSILRYSIEVVEAQFGPAVGRVKRAELPGLFFASEGRGSKKELRGPEWGGGGGKKDAVRCVTGRRVDREVTASYGSVFLGARSWKKLARDWRGALRMSLGRRKGGV